MQARFDEALRVLTRHGVEFIVVGGIAAVLQGSPLTTGALPERAVRQVVRPAAEESCHPLTADRPCHTV